jgi:hypothetical protein
MMSLTSIVADMALLHRAADMTMTKDLSIMKRTVVATIWIAIMAREAAWAAGHLAAEGVPELKLLTITTIKTSVALSFLVLEMNLKLLSIIMKLHLEAMSLNRTHSTLKINQIRETQECMKIIAAISSHQLLAITDKAVTTSEEEEEDPLLNSILTVTLRVPLNTREALKENRINEVEGTHLKTMVPKKTKKMAFIASHRTSHSSSKRPNTGRNQFRTNTMNRKKSLWIATRRNKSRKSCFKCLKTPAVMIRTQKEMWGSA